MEKELRIKEILNKLNVIQCPFVGKGKNTWVAEILFKPGLERYKIIQWILEKLEMMISEQSEQQNSYESKIQELQIILSSLGVCSTTDSDIIEGTASETKQLAFWEVLVAVYCNKMNFTNSSFSSLGLINESMETNRFKDYKSSCEYISKIYESLNLDRIFDADIQLFPVHLTKEMKPILKQNGSFISSKEIKQIQTESSLEDLRITFNQGIGDISIENVEEKTDCEIPNEDKLTITEETLSSYASNLENTTKNSFDDTYDNLKLYLTNAKPEEFVDIGPSFKTADEKLQPVLKLKNSINLLVSADTEVETLLSDISNFHLSTDCLSDTKLSEYIQIISEFKERE